jgi:hypothetical protein
MDMLVEELAKNEFGNTQKFVKNNKIKVLIENGKESFTIIMSSGQQNFKKNKLHYSLFFKHRFNVHTSKKKWHKLNKV